MAVRAMPRRSVTSDVVDGWRNRRRDGSNVCVCVCVCVCTWFHSSVLLQSEKQDQQTKRDIDEEAQQRSHQGSFCLSVPARERREARPTPTLVQLTQPL